MASVRLNTPRNMEIPWEILKTASIAISFTNISTATTAPGSVHRIKPVGPVSSQS